MSFARFIGRLWGNRAGDRLVKEMVAGIKAGKRLKSQSNPKSGSIEIVGEQLRYQSTDYGTWEIPVGDIKVVGEYTTDNGPYIDDWFLVFVMRDEYWVEASNYCGGQEAVREALANRLGVESLWGSLAYTTDFHSNVLVPACLAKQSLFEYHGVRQSVWSSIIRMGCKTVSKNLTPPVLQHLQSTV